VSLFDPNRGRIPLPDLDDRKWTDIVDQAKALIPTYAPQWTDHGSSDIGITLIELFAWMVEGLTYRLNQVPEKNYIAFLNLLGITRKPPEPARAFLTFSTPPGATTPPTTVSKGTQAQTAGSETEAPVVFETDEDVQVLPVNLEVALLIDKVAGSNKYKNISALFTKPPASGGTLTISGGQSAQLCLGFDAPTIQPINLVIRFFAPLPTPDPTKPPPPPVTELQWLYSSRGAQPSDWTSLADSAVSDGTKNFQKDGIIRLTVPGDWEKQAPSDWHDVLPTSDADVIKDDYFWIGLRIKNVSTGTPPPDVSFGCTSILFNAVSSHSALTIPGPEQIGVGSGASFQIFPLRNGPLYKQPDTDPPYGHLTVTVADEAWTLVDSALPGDRKIYRLDPVAAEITFGERDVPQKDQPIVATTYRYVSAGASANVGGGSIVAIRKLVYGPEPHGVITGVTNLAAAYGGSDQASIEDTKRSAPGLLRTRNRAVSKDDYEFLAMLASTELKSTRCLGPHYDMDPTSQKQVAWQYGGLDRSAGNINVIILPNLGPDISPTPQPTSDLLHLVAGWLDTRRDVAASVNVTGPRYLPINVQYVASVWPTPTPVITPADLKTYIEERVKKYFHPVAGGSDGAGWQVGQSVFVGDLYKAIVPPANWGYISSLLLMPGTPLYTSPNLPSIRPFKQPTDWLSWVQVADYELVCFGHVSPPT
jgi:predicted phage baseplate assembly protein